VVDLIKREMEMGTKVVMSIMMIMGMGGVVEQEEVEVDDNDYVDLV
jgi:hypothetical protein